MARITERAEPFVETWEAYKQSIASKQFPDIDTDNFRVGWPMPTIYREHEAIHILAGLLDQALAEIERLKTIVDEDSDE